MHETLVKFSGLNVLVIGDVMLDRFLEGTSSRCCPESGEVPVIDISAEIVRLGGAANVAANCAALGAESVTLVGVAGQDYEGHQIAGLMAEAEIIDRVTLVRDRATLVKTRVLNGGNLIARMDKGDVGGLGEYVEADITIFLQTCWDRFDVVFISDYGKGTMTAAIVEEIASLQYTNRHTLVIDAKDYEPYLNVPATAFTPNRAEKKQLDHNPRYSLADLIVETRDSEGCIGWRRDQDGIEVAGIPVDPAYPSGAGDTFAACLGMALASGTTPVAAMMLAVNAAGIVVGKPFTDFCSREELAATLNGGRHNEAQPRSGKPKVVLCTGCFDLIHAGHVHLLEQAKRLGDKLIVGLNSDESIARLKGDSRPVNTFEDRARMLFALRCVDEVIYFNDDMPHEVIAMVRPAVYVKSDEYDRDTLPEAELVEHCGGRCVFIPRLAGHSTTEMIERCQTANQGSR